MIRSAAIVPCPPLLVAHLAGAGTDPAVAALRAACGRAVAALPGDRWHVVGVDAAGPAAYASGSHGDFRGYGLDVDVRLGAGQPHEHAALPLPLLVAAWLAGEAGAATVSGEVVAPTTPRAACLARGRELAERFRHDGADVGLLVVGDGSRMHDAPGAGEVDPRASAFDDAVAAALSAADSAVLVALDDGLAAELGAEGRAAWHVLAGAALAETEAETDAETEAAAQAGARWRGELLWTGAPYGVGYHVAVWRR